VPYDVVVVYCRSVMALDKFGENKDTKSSRELRFFLLKSVLSTFGKRLFFAVSALFSKFRQTNEASYYNRAGKAGSLDNVVFHKWSMHIYIAL
jgi:hypothetical protein